MKKENTQLGCSTKGALSGASVGFRVAGPIGAVFGAIFGAIVGGASCSVPENDKVVYKGGNR